MMAFDGAADASGCPRAHQQHEVVSEDDSGDHRARGVSAPAGSVTSSPGILGG